MGSLLKQDEENSDNINLSLTEIISILDHLLLSEINLYKLTQKSIYSLFLKVKEHILCNYIDKISWLKASYGMQNSSFMNIAYMEEVPMNKFLVMYEIHKEAIEKINSTEN